ncbi:hypothetical protein CJ030_MR4G025267 [Morella rubra]|uniref:Myb/SANT-like domain-containing protein n=1 Tax=Morella rubra TaxID=262757 RepID=A0A6A1VRD5_9ROSI|nr:hypothetical protein CJ030_MR4G025267 [Morella rubra]
MRRRLPRAMANEGNVEAAKPQRRIYNSKRKIESPKRSTSSTLNKSSVTAPLTRRCDRNHRHFLRSGKERIVDLQPSSSTACQHTAVMSTTNKNLWKDEQRVSKLIELAMGEFNSGRVTNGKLGVANYEYIASIMKVDVPCLDGQKIKTKIENLRNEYRAFNNLRKRTGFGWDPTTQTVIADVPQWTECYDSPYATDKTLSRFMGKGLDHYDELVYMFGNTTSNGLMRRAPAQGPSTEEEERRLNIAEHARSVQIDLTDEDTPLPYTPVGDTRGTRKRPSPLPSGSGLRKKQSRDGETAEDPWEEASQNYLRAKADRLASSYTSRTSLVDDCIDNVYAIDPPLEVKVAAKAVDRIIESSTFRQAFMRIPAEQRRHYVLHMK